MLVIDVEGLAVAEVEAVEKIHVFDRLETLCADGDVANGKIDLFVGETESSEHLG